MADIPLQSPNKYGRDQYGDIDELADMLSGGTGARPARTDTVDVGPGNEAVDDDVLREAFNNPRKYGG